MTISPGENVGPYRVIEQLGSGGMATVFKAYHASLDRYVAIKVLHPAFKADPQFFERFKREARIVANLEHPNIIPVYDFNEHHGEPYLVMRFVEGDTLKGQMTAEPMPPDQILRLMRPVCQALNYAHNQGILHRDIKPSNIMVTRDGSIFITDFGLARMVQAGESTLSQDMMVGTPQYISPEQAQGMHDLDGRTDIYSLGVVLYEMVTGRVPFSADTPFATIHDHIYTPLPLPSTINPNIDPAIERILFKALAKEPDDRYATANDLLEALETILTSQVTAVSTIKPPESKPAKSSGVPWWVWAGSAVFIVCLVGALLAGIMLFRNRNNKQPVPNNEPVSGQVVDSNQPIDNTKPALPPNNQTDSRLADQQVDQPPSNDDTNPNANPQQARKLSEQASQAMRDQNYQEAADLFEEAMAMDPHYLPAYYGLSEALRQLDDVQGSVDTLIAATEANPDSPEAWVRLGEAQLRHNNPEDALKAFEEAATINPQNATAYAGQALSLLDMGQIEAAKPAIDQALSLDQGSPEAHFANAVYLAQNGNKRGALQELQRVIQNRRTSPRLKDFAQNYLDKLHQP